MGFAFTLKGTFQNEIDVSLLWEAGCQGIEESQGELIAYFANPVNLPLKGSWQEIEEINWLEAYYKNLKPIFLKHLIIAPTHCTVSPKKGEKVLWLDPGMAFGTGHHETTKLALETLEAIDLQDKYVLDVGSGSGILAIAADLLGAKKSLGIDNDIQTIPVAKANTKQNSSKAEFQFNTLSNIASKSADVLVANLFAELHVELVAEYKRVLKDKGIIIVTGILAERAPLVYETFKKHFKSLEIKTAGEWKLIEAKGII